MYMQLYIVLSERTTKTRSGAKSTDFRAVTPKMFEQPGNQYCPVKMFKLYISKRSDDKTNDPTSKFYLRPLDTPKEDMGYSHQFVGKNKLGAMLKSRAETAEVKGRKGNHSTRKTFATALLHSERPTTEVAQLCGWKGIFTLTHYNIPSVKQQDIACNIISDVMIPDISPDIETDCQENQSSETNHTSNETDNLMFDEKSTDDLMFDQKYVSSHVTLTPKASGTLFASHPSVISTSKSCSSHMVARIAAILLAYYVELQLMEELLISIFFLARESILKVCHLHRNNS